MKAKFVYEAIGDVLKPKSEEEIMSSIENKDLDPDNLLIKSAEIGFLSGVKKALKMGANVYDDALRWASKNGHYDIVKFLLENGADIHAKDDDALYSASYYAHYDVVKLLLEKGADVHADDDIALQYASKYGHYDVVKLLLEKGAKVHARNDEALEFASLNGHLDVVKLLKKYM